MVMSINMQPMENVSCIKGPIFKEEQIFAG